MPGTGSTTTPTSHACTASACSVAWACRWWRSAGRSTTLPGACAPRWRRTSASSTAGPLSDELLTLLEEMTMLDTTAQRRITLLVYADIAAAHDWLVRVFGLGPGRVDRDKEGRAVHGELYAGDGVIWMHREEKASALASPRSVGAATASVAVMVDDVDAHYRHATSEGATIVYEPVDQPYGYRVYSAHDLEGHLWSFMKPFA